MKKKPPCLSHTPDYVAHDLTLQNLFNDQMLSLRQKLEIYIHEKRWRRENSINASIFGIEPAVQEGIFEDLERLMGR